MRDTALVVPSIREESFKRFYREWEKTGLFERVDLILIEDNPEPTFPSLAWISRPPVHLSWKDIDQKSWGWIIPRRSDTVRSFGYWLAWNQGYEFLMTLDDDCYPAEGYEQLDLMHKSMLTRTKWFNTLNSVRPRGVPYRNLGERQAHVNHGIWQGVLDYDAPQQLVDPVPEVYTHDNRIVPHGSYFPFCGMNWMCRREAIPLMYHLLMGQTVGQVDGGGCPPECLDFDTAGALTRLPFDRFGDIWCGIIMKRICDHLGWVVGTGTPYIHHDRASNPFTNLRKEANGIEINEQFWGVIDNTPLKSSIATGCYKEIAFRIKNYGGEHSAYWQKLGSAMTTWADLFGP